MAMPRYRPVEISPASYLPVTAVASITHRITGVALFAGLAYLLWLLDMALASEEGFVRAAGFIQTPFGKLALWAVLAALAYHFMAGIKHLLFDFHVGDSLSGARRAAWLTLSAAALAALGLGVWLW